MAPGDESEPELGPASMWLLRAAALVVIATLGWFLVHAIIG